MRGIARLPEPEILKKKKIEWLQKLKASGKKRPDSSKYAHVSIRRNLESMSFHKCFYCESKLKGVPKEVDHHIEVSADINLSYEWDNLYLCCHHCNGKIDHVTIPVNQVLDPCIEDDLVIQKHLDFEDELIKPRNNSLKGLNTIKKFRLDSELLDAKRLKQLKEFYKVITAIQKNQIEEQRSYLSEEEKVAIESFKRIDNPYSLMFFKILDEY